MGFVYLDKVVYLTIKPLLQRRKNLQLFFPNFMFIFDTFFLRSILNVPRGEARGGGGGGGGGGGRSFLGCPLPLCYEIFF